MKFYLLLIWFIVAVLAISVTGCGRYGLGGSVSTQYSLDGVKRIAPGLGSNDPLTFNQSTYLVSTTSHLLLRFETLSTYVDNIDDTAGKYIQIQITVSDSALVAAAVSSLHLCPITKAWMMLASWELAHPFGGGDRWTTPGGDYEASGCVSGTQSIGTSNILYDMTQWFKDYPKGRKKNDGLILISSQDIVIIGETSGTYSPRILFNTF